MGSTNKMKEQTAQQETQKEIEREARRKWLTKPSKKNKDLPVHLQDVEILCTKCGHTWVMMESHQVRCPECRR